MPESRAGVYRLRLESEGDGVVSGGRIGGGSAVDGKFGGRGKHGPSTCCRVNTSFFQHCLLSISNWDQASYHIRRARAPSPSPPPRHPTPYRSPSAPPTPPLAHSSYTSRYTARWPTHHVRPLHRRARTRLQAPEHAGPIYTRITRGREGQGRDNYCGDDGYDDGGGDDHGQERRVAWRAVRVCESVCERASRLEGRREQAGQESERRGVEMRWLSASAGAGSAELLRQARLGRAAPIDAVLGGDEPALLPRDTLAMATLDPAYADTRSTHC